MGDLTIFSQYRKIKMVLLTWFLNLHHNDAKANND